MKTSELKQLIKEEINKILNESYKVISKKTEKSPYENKKFDDYSLELNDEMYTTPDGLTFQLKTIGFTSLPTGKELNLNEPNYYFYYIQNYFISNIWFSKTNRSCALKCTFRHDRRPFGLVANWRISVGSSLRWFYRSARYCCAQRHCIDVAL